MRLCRPRALRTPLDLRGRPMAERMRVTRKKEVAVGADIVALLVVVVLYGLEGVRMCFLRPGLCRGSEWTYVVAGELSQLQAIAII